MRGGSSKHGQADEALPGAVLRGVLPPVRRAGYRGLDVTCRGGCRTRSSESSGQPQRWLRVVVPGRRWRASPWCSRPAAVGAGLHRHAHRLVLAHRSVLPPHDGAWQIVALGTPPLGQRVRLHGLPGAGRHGAGEPLRRAHGHDERLRARLQHGGRARQVQSDEGVEEHVREADAILVEVGATTPQRARRAATTRALLRRRHRRHERAPRTGGRPDCQLTAGRRCSWC